MYVTWVSGVVVVIGTILVKVAGYSQRLQSLSRMSRKSLATAHVDDRLKSTQPAKY